MIPKISLISARHPAMSVTGATGVCLIIVFTQAAKMADQWLTEIILHSIHDSHFKLQYYHKYKHLKI